MEKNLPIKGILFDLDGTLIDTAPDFILSLNNLLSKYEKPHIDSSVIRSNVSDGSGKMIKIGFGIDEKNDQFESLKKEFLIEYKKNLLKNSFLFDGIATLIDFLNLKYIDFGIVTNKPREYAEPLIKNIPELNQLKVLVCSDDLSQSKPNPEGIIESLKQMGISSSECIYVGDHINDLKAGINAGTKIIACYYGYSLSNRNNPYNCDSVDDAKELRDLINKYV